MAVNKNFVVKNGLEVNTNLIVADAITDKVGIGTTVPEYTLHVANSDGSGGIGATHINVTGVGTFGNELRVGTGGTVFSVIAGPSGVGQSVGIRTAEPAYLLDVRSPVSTGETALYVKGDVRFTGITTSESTVFASQLSIAGISTFVGFATFNDYVYIQDGLDVTGTGITATTLNVTGVSTFGDNVYISGITSVGAAITMYPTTGIVSATAYYGDGSNLTGIATNLTATIGISSGGTVIGTGITVVDYRMTNGTLTVAVPPETAPGVATVTINPQVSLGLVIALGG
jgi:hypothetical protein